MSMTETMHCYENAKAERVNGILKQEDGPLVGGPPVTIFITVGK